MSAGPPRGFTACGARTYNPRMNRSSLDPRSPRAPWCLSLLLAVACAGGGAPSDKASGGDGAADGGADSSEGGGDDGIDGADTGATNPCAHLTASPSVDHAAGHIPFRPTLSGAASCGPAEIVEWRWEIGGTVLTGVDVQWTGLQAGTFSASLTVTDAAGDTDTGVLSLEVVPQECPEVQPELTLGLVADDELVEASGLIVSRRDPEILWTHNDSGDTARLFALDRDGAALGTWSFDLPDSDWEDLAWGTDPDTQAPLLFIGDTGDNSGARESLKVYILEEPVVDRSAGPIDTVVTSWKTLTLHTPEPVNVDSLFVDPVTGDLFLLSDDTTSEVPGPAYLLRKPAPHLDGEEVTLEVAGQLAFGGESLPGDAVATGADTSPDGDRIVVRTREEAWLWMRDGSQSVSEALLGGAPCPVPLPVQPLGESVAFDIRDGGLLTVSEGVNQPVLRVPFVEVADCFDEMFAVLEADPPTGPLPFTVSLSAAESCVPAGLREASWSIEGMDETLLGETVSATFLASGRYSVLLTLEDMDGDTVTASTELVVESGDCPVAGEGETLGEVTDETLSEISGVVVGRLNPEVLWVHNDSGHEPILYALNREGALVGSWTLDVPSGDIEDIAAGYGADGTPELWLGRIGDNEKDKESIALYRVDEPLVVEGEEIEHTLAEADIDTLTLTYPEGPRNCETLLLDPVSGDLLLVTKDTDGLSDVYRKAAPHTDGETAVLEHVASLTFGGEALPGSKTTTGGEFSPDGAWIAVRTYSSTAWLWRRDQSATLADAFNSEACPLDLPTETQGESLCFDADGGSVIAISEGVHPPIHRTPLSR